MKRLIGCSLIFFSCAAWTQEGLQDDFCESIKPWKLSLCADSASALKQQTSALSRLLEESLIRTRRIPEKVLSAGQAVFNICVPYRFRGWTWNCQGASGFFLFDNRTFVTNHHVLSGLLYKEEISDWSEVAFRDQKGGYRDFHIKGVRFLSKMNDIAVLEVEGYAGPALQPAEATPGEQSYIIGYPGHGDLKIQPVRSIFDAGEAQYGAFIELFDCAYGFDLSGSSGGPLLSEDGRVQGVFANMIHLPSSCPFLLAKKMEFLKKIHEMSLDTISSISRIKLMIKTDIDEFARRVESGDREAQLIYSMERFEYPSSPLLDPSGMLASAYNNGHNLAEFFMLKDLFQEESTLTKNLVHTVLKQGESLAITYYEAGLAVYYIEDNFKKACELWMRAGDLGHPYIDSNANAVVAPYMSKIFICELD